MLEKLADNILYIEDSLYFINIYIVKGGELKEAYKVLGEHLGEKEYERHGEDEYLGVTGRLITKEDNGNVAVLWLKNPNDLYIVVHELYHLVNFVLQGRGIEPATDGNDEHYAYYLQWLFKKYSGSVDEK